LTNRGLNCFHWAMKDPQYLLNPNKLVQYLKKPATQFTGQDIIRFIEENGIEMLNFRYAGGDGRLKTLNFVIQGREHLEMLFSTGERVDGSSLFSYISSDSSDLYIIPRFRTAFVNPFSDIPAIDILCSFYTREGRPLESAPEYILRKAHTEFKRATGYTLKAMGELEYYVIGERSDLYPVADQKGYHASPPFSKWDCLRKDALKGIAEAGARVKYGHSEVGAFSMGTQAFEQHEIEFLPVDVEDAADHLMLGKWVLRMVAYRYGVNISLAPKIAVGKAGNGLHIHMLVEKNGENLMADEEGLSDIGRKVIAGLLDLAAPLTAFGNTIPASYLRLVPGQEAPTKICWGDRNRSVLVRVPLGWVAKTRMIKDANPQETGEVPYIPGKQTIEFRSPDGSADIYSLLAGIVMAAQHGLEMPDALERARELYVDVDIYKEEHKSKRERLDHLPTSCWESAECLHQNRDSLENHNVFPSGTIDMIIRNLKSYNDSGLIQRLGGKEEEIRNLVDRFLHCG
jgi:glutamine synthetase